MAKRPTAAAARNALLLLAFVNLFNYVDRFIIPAITVSLRDALHVNDTQIGLFATSFIIVYAIASPFLGELGDRGNRPRLIAAGVAIWSVATVLGGFAWGFVSLLVARAVLGIGEAAYGSIAPALLADAFARAKRARVFAVFYAAIPIGSALGYIIGGQMDKHFGWRSAFFAAGAPGLILAALLLALPDPPRGGQADDMAAAPPTPRPSRLRLYAGLIRNGKYMTTVLGYAAYTFALGALAVWTPAYLTRVHGIPRATAATQTGLIAVATGFIGTFAGGWLGDYFHARARHAYLWFAGAVTLLAVPFTVILLMAQRPTYFYPALVVAELLLFATAAPVNSSIVNYVAPTQRATAMAFSILVMHLLGDAPSPAIVGWISDAGRRAGLTDAAALQRAMMILPFAIAVSGLIWLVGARRGRHEPREAGSGVMSC